MGPLRSLLVVELLDTPIYGMMGLQQKIVPVLHRAPIRLQLLTPTTARQRLPIW